MVNSFIVCPMDFQNLVFLDMETTGFYPKQGDEVLEIGIVDWDGRVVMDQLIKPTHNETWDEAQEINKISPARVKNAPSFQSIEPALGEALAGNLVAIYNADFELRFIPSHIAKRAERFVCVMRMFHEYVPESRYRLKDALKWAHENSDAKKRPSPIERNTMQNPHG